MTQVGSVYGEALYELAKSEALEEEILSQMQLMNEAFEKEPDFLRLLCSPTLSKDKRVQILDESFRGKIQQYLLNFLKILTEKGYIRHFAETFEAFTQHYNKDHNILPVTAVTAVAMKDAQRTALTEKLTRMTGKTIRLSNRVDPSCMGGVRLVYDGRQLDDTVSHRMDDIKKLLSNTAV